MFPLLFKNIPKRVLVKSVGFAYLALGAVAVYGMFEMTFADANHYFDWKFTLFDIAVDNSYGESRKNMLAVGKEHIKVFLRDEVL